MPSPETPRRPSTTPYELCPDEGNPLEPTGERPLRAPESTQSLTRTSGQPYPPTPAGVDRINMILDQMEPLAPGQPERGRVSQKARRRVRLSRCRSACLGTPRTLPDAALANRSRARLRSRRWSPPATSCGQRSPPPSASGTTQRAESPPPHMPADVGALRLAIDIAVLEARNAGCDVDDLVGPNVGRL